MMQLRWLVLIAVCVLSAWAVRAEDAAETSTEWIQGKVEVVKDEAGKIEKAMVVYDDMDEDNKPVKVSYMVVLDEKGAAMAASMAGKKVDVTGTVENKGTEEKPIYWITVKSCEETKVEPAAAE